MTPPSLPRRRFLLASLMGGVAALRTSARAAAFAPPPAVVSPAYEEGWPVRTGATQYRFDRTISEAVLNGYLSRAVTHFGLLASSPEPATECFDDDLRMLTSVGAKFAGRAAYAWEPPNDDEAHFRQAAERALALHRADPEMILQAAVFETAYRKVERIPVPEWVFAEWGLPAEPRTFRYEEMLYDGGRLRDHWMHDASVPDMSKRETQMWFYYRARRYLDAGCEAIHFGQVHLMGQNDPGFQNWSSLLTRIRQYAGRYARRRMVLCDAHTHGIVNERGVALFDYHAWPSRPQEIPGGLGGAQDAQLTRSRGDTIIGHSRGGQVVSGWSAPSLPYLIELDNFGSSGRGGQPDVGAPWVWGYDEIDWFAHQDEAARNRILVAFTQQLRALDPLGHFELPTRRVLADPVNGIGTYRANRRGGACPKGFNQEETIKAIFAAE